MTLINPQTNEAATSVVRAFGEDPKFHSGEAVRISVRFPIGHYRVPTYIRGKQGIVELLLHPAAVNNEEEGFGRNAGSKGFYYRVAIPLTELWPGYTGSAKDRLVIEIFETWLERIES